jgi:hypothetical protein
MSIEAILSGITGISDGGRNTAEEFRDVLTDMTAEFSGVTFSGTTDEIPEGIDNLYYTEVRVDEKLIDYSLTGHTHNIGDLDPSSLDELTDVTLSGTETDQILKYNGTQWVNATQFHTLFENYIIVAKTGGNYDKIQDAIEYANDTYTGRTLNSPVVIIVYPGEYREQIHSYQNILIISSASAYDPVQGQAKSTIIMSGDTPSNYPLRTEVGDVYYMVGISIYTDTVDGVLGRLPEGTFKNCSTRYGHFIENEGEFTNSQFKDCKFNSNTYGGFNVVSASSVSGSRISLDRCVHFGRLTFLSTHPSSFGFIETKWSDIRGTMHIAGDWGIQNFQLRVSNVTQRNTFDTTSEVKFQGGYVVNGIEFLSAPSDLIILQVAFDSIADNKIPDGEADITADVVINGRVQGNIMHNGLSSNIHMDNPDKYVGQHVNDSYMSIKAALDSITDSGPTKRYTIQISSGLYTEDNPLQAKEYVAVVSNGDLQTTRIIAANPDEDLLIMANLFTIEGVAFWGVSGANNYAVNQSTAASTTLTRCMFGECTNGILVNDANAQLVVNDIAFFNPTVSLIRGVYCQSGVFNAYDLFANYGTIGTLVEITGVNSSSVLNNVNSVLSTLTTGISIKDSATVDVNHGKLNNMATGIEIEGGVHVHFNAVRIDNATVDGVRVNNVGADAFLNAQGTIVENSTNFDFNILSPTCLVVGNVTISINKLNLIPGSKFYGTILDLEEDDEGVNILGELHVGLPERGTESVFGEGDSYTRGMLVYTETPGNIFVDVSADAQSASVSTFTFPGSNLNNAIYVASTLQNADTGDKLQHYGIKSNVTNAGIPGTNGNIVIEYYNGVSWIEVNGMEVTNDGSYYPQAKNYFEEVGAGHHLRYNNELAIDSWTKHDPVGIDLGTDYYWVRFRIESAIQTRPVFEQFKLHTNRTELNADGWLEYFGKARPIGQLASNFSAAGPFDGIMSSEDLFINNNLAVGYTLNKFNDTGDITGIEQYLPFDADTSTPIKLQWSGLFTNSQSVEFTIRWGWVKQGDTYFTSNPLVQPNLNIITVPKVVIAGIVEEFEASLNIERMIARRAVGQGDKLMISMQVTTLNGSFSIGPSQITYTKWCEGGHI